MKKMAKQWDTNMIICHKQFLERDAPYNPLCTHYNSNNKFVSHSTNYTFYRVTY